MKVTEAISTLKSYLREKNLKYTHQRQVVTEVFFDTAAEHLHLTIDELFLRVRAVDPKIGYATVYRTIKLFEECKLASPRRFGDNQTRYEPEVPGEHHDHMICRYSTESGVPGSSIRSAKLPEVRASVTPII